MRRAAVMLLLLVPFAVPAGAAEPAPLPPGSLIAGVDVGGLDATAADRAVRNTLVPVYEKRPIAIRVDHRDSLVMPAEAGMTIDYEYMVERAFETAGAGRVVDIRLRLSVNKPKLRAVIAAQGKRWYRAPRNAKVRFGVTAIRRVRARMGRALDQKKARLDLNRELRHPTEGRVVKGKLFRVVPAVTTRGLRKRYPAYVSVDRDTHTLRLFRALRLVRTYQVAVGAAGFETPAGMRSVLSKQRNPSWTAPNRPWASPYQGQTFPPGDPNNPLREWFIALGDGIGIHGTSEEWTVGTSASHGCIRMRAADINNLAPLVPVGAPVRIH